MTTYLVVYNGKVSQIIHKDKPLLPSDIDSYFEQVIMDKAGGYKVKIGDDFDFDSFIARNQAYDKINSHKRIVDVKGYKR
jgi:hypothetical protein